MSFIRQSSSPIAACGWQEDGPTGAIRRGPHCHYYPQNSTWWGFLLKWGSVKETALFCVLVTLFSFDLATGSLGVKQKLGIHHDCVNKLCV